MLMIGCLIMLAGVVCPVSMSAGSKEVEQLLSYLALEPLEPQVIGCERIGGHGANSKATGSVVASGDWCGLCLWVPRFFKRYVVRHDALASIVDGTNFYF